MYCYMLKAQIILELSILFTGLRLSNNLIIKNTFSPISVYLMNLLYILSALSELTML